MHGLFGIFKYVTLGYEVFNAVTTLIAMFKAPVLLTPAGVQAVIDPVIQEIAAIAKITISPALVDQIVTDAVNTIKSILGGQVPPAP